MKLEDSSGKSVSRKAAEEALQQQACIELTEEDWQVLIEAFSNPPPANQRLRKAFLLHRQCVKQ